MDKITSKVLVVDDEATNRKLLKAILADAGEGYVVLEADSGMAALKTIEEEQPDILLLDVMMPGMDGYEVCEKLKSHKKQRNIPVLFITALDANEDMVKCFSSGGADYITKPINAEEIKARVKTHLRIKRAEEEHIESENLRTVQNMVATYNHNMNQPLTVIYSYLNMLTAVTALNDKEYKTLEKIKKELDKINSILQKIQAIQKVEPTDYVGNSGMLKLD